MQDVGVHQAEELRWQVLRELRDEREAKPTFSAAFGNSRHLLKQRPVPTDKIVVRVSVPLQPGSKYLARVRGATNLNGAKADGVTVLAVPVPKPVAKDTTKAPRDTTRVRKDTIP